MALYIQCASAALALVGAGRWEVLWSDQHRTEKQRLEENIQILNLQRDNYMCETEITSTSLVGLGNVDYPFLLEIS